MRKIKTYVLIQLSKKSLRTSLQQQSIVHDIYPVTYRLDIISIGVGRCGRVCVFWHTKTKQPRTSVSFFAVAQVHWFCDRLARVDT
jgi:hypothetical protein